MKRIACFLIPLATLVALVVPASAQTQYRFEVFGAVTIPVEKNFEIGYPQASPPLELTHEYSPGARGGVRLGVDGAGHWGQDFMYSYGANATKIVNHGNLADFAFTARVHQAAWNLLWYPGGLGRDTGAFPYVTAGVGGIYYTVSQHTVNQALDPDLAGIGKLRNTGTFAFNAGAGVRMKASDKFGVRIDFRDFMTQAVRYGLPKGSSDPDAVVFPAGGIFHQFEVSFAVVYYF